MKLNQSTESTPSGLTTASSHYQQRGTSSLPTRIMRALFSKKMLTLLSILALIAIGIWSAVLFKEQYDAQTKVTITSPTYQTILPDGNTVDNYGGWKRVSPPDNDPVFAYVDVINGIAIKVSQQPLPTSFKEGVADKVAEFAKQSDATHKIDAGGIPTYIGTNAKGPQSVIFTKNGLLVLIKSDAKIADISWIAYIKGLR